MNRKPTVYIGIMTGVGEDDPRILIHGTKAPWEARYLHTAKQHSVNVPIYQEIKLAGDPDDI